MTRINDNGTDRNMTADEKAVYDEWAEQARNEQTARAAALDARNAALQSAHTKLTALGLTDNEIAALLGR